MSRIRKSYRGATLALATSFVLAAAAHAADPTKPAEPSKSRRIVLVDVTGSNIDVDPFVARLESELADKDITLVDARILGTALATAMAEPLGPVAKALREQYPGNGYLSLAISTPVERVQGGYVPQTELDRTGRYEQKTVKFVGTLATECNANALLVDAPGGKTLAKFQVTGHAGTVSGDTEGVADESAAIDAAERAFKKIVKALK